MNIALVGVGAITRRGHLPGLRPTPFRPVALVDSNEELLREVADEFDVPGRHIVLDAILNDPDIEAVAVCTSTNSHFELARRCIEAGKHVIVEKPLAFSYIEARELAALAKKSETVQAVIQNWRFFRQVLAARRRVHENKIGRIHLGHALSISRFPNGWTRSHWLYHKRGVLYDFAPHVIDMSMFLLDKTPKTVFSWCADFTGEMNSINFGKLVVEFDDNLIFSFDLSWLTGSLVFQVTLHGTAGHVFLDVRNNLMFEVHGSLTPVDLMTYYLSSTYVLAKDIITKHYVFGPMQYYSMIYNNFFDSICRRSNPFTSFEEALQTNLILDGAYLDSALKQPVDIAQMTEGAYDDQFLALLKGDGRSNC